MNCAQKYSWIVLARRVPHGGANCKIEMCQGMMKRTQTIEQRLVKKLQIKITCVMQDCNPCEPMGQR